MVASPIRWSSLELVDAASNLVYAGTGVSSVSASDTELTPSRHQRGGIVDRWHTARLAQSRAVERDQETIMRVLVVEDFEILARTIGTGLRREGMAVDVVLDGDDALDHLAVTHYDVVVLDRDLPGTHGDEVCRQIVAEHSHSRVLMLTAASTVKERVDGLGLGADDYLPKPFDFAELVARIRALGRRPVTALPPTLERGDLTLDPNRRVALRAGRRLDLSPKEFAVLECLLAAAGRLVSTEELLERVWDEEADPFTTAVKTTIRRLRAKLGDPPVIHTVREGGYRIGAP
jgi:DNA-binding response OmpR family regulator